MTILLKGKNCFVTGASGGLGKAIAEEFGNRGCNLFLTGRNEEKLARLKDDLKRKNPLGNYDYFSADISDIGEIETLVEKARAALGEINILINSAGIFPVGEIEGVSLKQYDECFNVNVKAPFILSRMFAVDMRKKNWGRIVNIGSSSSYAGYKGTAVYCSTKHAILGLGRAMYAEWKDEGVRVFTVSPGSLKTEMGRDVVGQDYDTFIKPQELAHFVADIISYDNEMISEEIRVNRVIVQ
jgi:short-subunit dehydrogenase